MAEDWGKAPWEIEDEISETWYQRWLMLSSARANAREVEQKRANTGKGNRTVKEL